MPSLFCNEDDGCAYQEVLSVIFHASKEVITIA